MNAKRKPAWAFFFAYCVSMAFWAKLLSTSLSKSTHWSFSSSPASVITVSSRSSADRAIIGARVPGIDLPVPGGNGLQRVHVRIRELVDDGLRHLPVCVVHDPLLRPGDGVGKALNDLRMRRHIALAGEIGGVGDLPGLLADGAEDIPVSGALYLRGGGLKQRHIVP